MLNLYNDGNEMTAELSGDIDHHAARAIRQELDRAISHSQPGLLIFDMEKVGFMDSSGIGLILGRLRAVRAYGGDMAIRNATAETAAVIRLSGLSELLEEGEKNEARNT